MNLQASSDEAKTANSGAKGVTVFAAAGILLCIYEPSRIGATTTWIRIDNDHSISKRIF
jgi:hypothetical protein